MEFYHKRFKWVLELRTKPEKPLNIFLLWPLKQLRTKVAVHSSMGTIKTTDFGLTICKVYYIWRVIYISLTLVPVFFLSCRALFFFFLMRCINYCIIILIKNLFLHHQLNTDFCLPIKSFQSALLKFWLCYAFGVTLFKGK